jgi:hypothetical protein
MDRSPKTIPFLSFMAEGPYRGDNSVTSSCRLGDCEGARMPRRAYRNQASDFWRDATADETCIMQFSQVELAQLLRPGEYLQIRSASAIIAEAVTPESCAAPPFRVIG